MTALLAACAQHETRGFCPHPAGEHTAPAPLLGSLAGALLSGVREAARAYKLVKLEEEDDLEVRAQAVGEAWAGAHARQEADVHG